MQAGLGGWLLQWARRRQPQHARLILVERITLAPRQSLSLVEVEGKRILVATAGDGVPAFFTLETEHIASSRHSGSEHAGRVSW